MYYKNVYHFFASPMYQCNHRVIDIAISKLRPQTINKTTVNSIRKKKVRLQQLLVTSQWAHQKKVRLCNVQAMHRRLIACHGAIRQPEAMIIKRL
jgi:hypothetical protein